MILILLAAAAVSGVLGYVEGEGYTDVIIILSVVLLNAILGVYQESKAEKAIEALQQMSAATCKVLRDGMLTVLPSEELVPGDVVLLEAGDAVPADGRLLQAASLKIEEAALTGESVPVEKMVEALEIAAGEQDVPLGDRRNMVYMGSSVVYGRGVAVITGTGMNTEMGKIADALAQAEDGDTPLQIKLRQLSKILTWLVLGICVAIFAVQMLRAGGLSLRTTLEDAGVPEILEMQRGYLRVKPELIRCDLYRFMAGDIDAVNSYRGEYMSNYSWAELTEAYMDRRVRENANAPEYW